MSDTSYPLLEKLSYHGIFSLERLPSGDFEIAEACDGYFKLTLTPEELRRLARELIQLSHEN